MICSNCGAANEPGRKFCDECGTRLAIGCPTCGAENRPGARFCGECGTALTSGAGERAPDRAAEHGAPATAPAPVSAPDASHAQPQPAAERRLVSILFADLVGFTTLAEGRDPEETRELLSRYFESSREIVERYGGTVEKF
ncbi:MAG TPA: zinc-ribbon domain-containing protein, partial [Candidatus Limnocylindrales bacterium]